MNDEVRDYVAKYPAEIAEMFMSLRKLIFDSTLSKPDELLWAKLPSYYVGDSFVRLIPFANHINIESTKMSLYKDKLIDYKMTPKGMLQIYVNQNIPSEVLANVFTQTFEE